MFDHRAEIASRARRLIETQGSVIRSTINGEITSRSIRIDGFHMRILNTGELYISDMRLGANHTIFGQREVDSTGAFRDFNYEELLLVALQRATVLEDLANL